MYDLNSMSLGMAASNVFADVANSKCTGLKVYDVTLLKVTDYEEKPEVGPKVKGLNFKWNLPAIREAGLLDDFIAMFPKWLSHVDVSAK